MLPKRILALTLITALAVMPTCVLRAQWVQVNKGFNACNVTSFAIIDSNFFVGTGSGFYRSTNNGEDWFGINNGFSGYSVNILIAVDSTLVAGTDSGVFRSTNLGLNWLPVNSGLTIDPLVNSFRVLGPYILAGTWDSGVFISADGGQNWNIADSGLPSKNVFGLDVHNSVLFVGTNDGILKSTDSGKVWRNIDSEISNISFFAITDSDVFVSGSDDNITPYVFRSSNNGDTWVRSDSGTNGQVIVSLYGAAVNGSQILAMGTYADTPNYPKTGVFRWNNTSMIWALDSLISGFDVSDSIIFSGGEDGLTFSSDLGESWQQHPGVGLSCSGVLSFIANGSNLFATSAIGLFLSTDSGITWNYREGSDLPQNLIFSTLAVHDNYLFLGTSADSDESKIFRSSDSGTTWSQIFLGSPNPYPIGALLGAGSKVFTTVGNKIFISNDDGDNWDTILIQNFVGNALYANDPILYAAYYSKYPSSDSAGILISTDYGETWNIDYIDIPNVYNYYFTNIADCNSNLFVTYGGSSIGGTVQGVLLSSDNGKTWSDITNRFSDDNDLPAFFAVIGRNIFAASPIAYIYLSTNNGSSWVEVDSGLSGTFISDIIVMDSDVLLGTDFGIYRRPLSEMIPPPSAVAAVPPASNSIQIYPNPFSQSTQITFASQTSGYAEISIVNILGAQVAQLFSGELDSGEHSFLWSNPTGLPDGTYECLVRMNGQMQTLPVVLLH